MFEEIPRERRGLARIRARRIDLGPFAMGGGLLLAMLGGSIAVAATAFTVSTGGFSTSPHSRPAQHDHVVVAATSSSQTRPASTRPPSQASTSQAGISSSPTLHESGGHTASSVASAPRLTSTPGSTVSPSASPTDGSGSSTTPSSTGPAGNATIYVTAYDVGTRKLSFEYAKVATGSGPGGADVYSVASDETYSAGLAQDIRIISGGTICPPAGNSCTPDELAKAAPSGFFAVVGLDASGDLRLVIEHDNATSAGSVTPSSSPSTSAAPSGSSVSQRAEVSTSNRPAAS
jgi:hypothetical protein